MPSTIVAPQDSRTFDPRTQGWVIRVYKTAWNHVVRYIAKDGRGVIISEGTVPADRPFAEFLVHPDVGFEIINVGTWPMDVQWPGTLELSGSDADTELDQVVSNLPWADAFTLGAGVDAITGGTSGRAVASFTPTQPTADKSTESYRFIQNESDLQREIELSASGKYNIEGVKVSASTSYLGTIEFSELSTTLIARFESSMTEYDEAESYALTSEATAALGDPPKFRKAYGDYFVAGGKRASRFLAVYRCQATTAKSMDEFKASFGGDVPEVFSAEGSARFLQSASKHNVTTSFDLFIEGYHGTPPSGPWTPETILAALTWFKANSHGIYLRAKLKHYSTIAPSYPRTVDVAPDVFVDLRLLYSRLWDIRSRYATLPTHYANSFKTEFRELEYGVEASQGKLATDAALRQHYRQAAEVLAQSIDDVFARQDFYFEVENVVGTEPAVDHRIEEGDGQQAWQYGFSVYSKSSAVVIHETQLTFSEKWTVGHREKTLEFGPDDRYLLVGWKVVSNWGDGTNGGWWKAVDQILLTSHGGVHVKSLYDRGCSWTVSYYYVDAKDYQFRS